jgi:AcrR family transcriptional regulator
MTGASATGPLTRAEQQSRTRATLVASARTVFARDGFHGANLAAIAREAGVTKGAVYSNFDGKADLFFAVMDSNLQDLDPETWDPLAPLAAIATAEKGARTRNLAPPEQEALGFGLATLEFVASATRDPDLSEQLWNRLERFREGFAAIARRRRKEDDPLGVDDLAVMLLAFDQGISILWLIGWLTTDADAVRRGMIRMLTPSENEDDPRL